MKAETRKALHFGVNFVMAPQVVLDGAHCLRFQGELAKAQLDFTSTRRLDDGGLVLEMAPRDPFHVQVGLPGQGVCQLLIVAPHPAQELPLFIKRVEQTIAAFRRVWPEASTVVARDANIRHLFESGDQHAFRLLWEKRLAQPGDDMQLLGRQALGGGLRIVLAATPAQPYQVEVKVESYLQDSSKLYVEVHGVWAGPGPTDTALDAKHMLTEVDSFAQTRVREFIQRGLD